MNKIKDKIKELEKDTPVRVPRLEEKRRALVQCQEKFDLVSMRLEIRTAEVGENTVLAATLRKKLEKLPGFESTMLPTPFATSSTSVSHGSGTDSQSIQRSGTRKNSGSPKASKK